MKKKNIFAVLLVIVMMISSCAVFTGCGSDSGSSEIQQRTEEPETRPEIKVMSKDEFVSMFKTETITNDNLFDYLELTHDDKYYYLSPKDGVLLQVARQSGDAGFYASFKYDATYDVEFFDRGTFVMKQEITQSEERDTLFSPDDNRIRMVALLSEPTMGKTVNGTYLNYKMYLKEIKNITLEKSNQTPYSICRYEPKTDYYNDIDGEKVLLYKYLLEGANIESYKGITESGKKTSFVSLDEKNGKYYLRNVNPGEEPAVTYEEHIYEYNKETYGNYAWFPDLLQELLKNCK